MGNEGRGYVLRRLLRRAARHGRKLGIEGQFMAGLAATVIELSKDGYPELEDNKAMIFKVLEQEEDKFNKTIDQGLSILNDRIADMQAKGENTLAGADAFKLYDTYGFPLDLTREILEEKGYGVDEDGFAAAMKEQKDKARNARKTTNYMGADVTVYQSIDPAITTEFVGYNNICRIRDTRKPPTGFWKASLLLPTAVSYTHLVNIPTTFRMMFCCVLSRSFPSSNVF